MLRLVSKFSFHIFAKAPLGKRFGEQKEIFFLLVLEPYGSKSINVRRTAIIKHKWLTDVCISVFLKLRPKRCSGLLLSKCLRYGAFNLFTYFNERKQ